MAPFKKGPDYIDAAWLSMAAKRPCRNLDLFMMPGESVLRSFCSAAEKTDVAVIEGNRGLFDGLDAQGTCSTAELAKLIAAPVILAVDCTKSTRTVAAIVLGCQQLDPQLCIQGVILNRTAGSRHESVLRESIQQICGLPVLGAIRKLAQQVFPERHLGLVPPAEHDKLSQAIDKVAGVADRYLDLEAIHKLAVNAPALDPPGQSPIVQSKSKTAVRVGVFRDAAFQFYYPENLEALAREGASLIEISPIRDAALPEVDALYVGGGFPETLAPALSGNNRFIVSLRQAIDKGLPVYAECGGAVYLGEKLLFDQKQYKMAGVLPISFGFQAKPQGHGYAELETVNVNPFFPVGDTIRGHEFHYTYMESSTTEDLTFAFRVRRGYGFDGQRDGLCHRNVLACYTHVHALGTEQWPSIMIRAAARFRSTVPPTAFSP